MEQVKMTFSIEPLIEKLKSGDQTVNEDIKKYEEYLRSKYKNSNMEVHMRLGSLYQAAGLIEKAKDTFYTAKRYADEEGKPEMAELIMNDVRSLPGTIN